MAETLLISTHCKLVESQAKDWKRHFPSQKANFWQRNKLLFNSRMSEIMQATSNLLSDEKSSQEQREAIMIDKFVLDLIQRLKECVLDSDNIENSLQIPLYLEESTFCPFSIYNLYFFKRIVFESEYYLEEYLREYPIIGIFSKMFKCLCSFVKEEYELKSKRSSMLNHIPFLKFIINLFSSLGVEVKVNDYLRDENGNVQDNQLLAIIYEQFNICGIVSTDLSIESEQEWRNCILISQIMQRKKIVSYGNCSLCFIIHGCKITFFYSHQHHDLDCFLFNKIQTWDFCNADHVIELVGYIFNFTTLSWRISKNPNPFG